MPSIGGGGVDLSDYVTTSDGRLADTRTPTDSTVTNAKVAGAAAIAESKLALASDAAAGTASRRSLGTTSTTAAAGNHTHAAVGGHAGMNTNTFPGFNVTNGTYDQVPLAGQDLYGGVTVSSNALNVPTTGLYRVGIRLYITGGSGYSAYLALRKNGAAGSFPGLWVYKSDAANDNQGFVQIMRRLTAADALTLWITRLSGAGGAYWGNSGYDGIYLEVDLVTV